jgi:valyl-tRNA synthetase
VVEKEIAAEGLSRHDLGRAEFLKRVWSWKERYGARIIIQLQALGCAFDWSRERFTMDDAYADAILEEFIRLFDADLIYRGARVINWCPRCATALSDIEVEYVERASHLWHIRYPFADGNGSVTVATTRPETMLGDVAVAVNPADPRYAGMEGRQLNLPLTGRDIPLIFDDYASMEFGTGAVKVTPAHDLNDFEAGRRHRLPQIVVIGGDGRMTAEAGDKYAGLTREEARQPRPDRRLQSFGWHL